MNKNPHGIVVGQKLWFESSIRGTHATEAVVTKVGRAWITFNTRHSEYRADIETLDVDGKGFARPGQLWLTKELADAEKYSNEIRSVIARSVSLGSLKKVPISLLEQLIVQTNGPTLLDVIRSRHCQPAQPISTTKKET